MQGFLNPNEVLKQLNLTEEMTAADFGCGSGGWVVPLAKILEGGRVYAIDIQEEPLSALRMKTNIDKLQNIKVIKADIEKPKGSTLYNSCCDLVLIANILFQSNNKKEILEEAQRVLKPGGKILVVDWKKDAPLGPEEGRVAPEDVKNIAQSLGLKFENEIEASSFHFGLVFTK
jgi:ubiquinone/menaquinone biosynthesis C-methylase UbiE